MGPVLMSQDTVKKSPSRGFQETVQAKKDSELEVILRRRRKQACDPGSGGKATLSSNIYVCVCVCGVSKETEWNGKPFLPCLW